MIKREEIQEEALKATLGLARCGLGLATGVGKTLVGLLHIERNYSPLINILIVAPKVSIFGSWRYEVQKFGGWKETLLSGEGLVTQITGPGEVLIQTKNIQELVKWLWVLLEPRVRATTAR